MEDRPIPVYGDGLQVRDWIHVTDNCRALMTVLGYGRSGATYHIGGNNPRTNRSVLEALLRVLEKPEALLTEVTDRLGTTEGMRWIARGFSRSWGGVRRSGLKRG